MGFGRRLSSVDPVFVRLCLCVYKLDPFNLHFSSSAMVAGLVRWSYVDVARRLPDCLLQQGLPGSGDGGVMTSAHLRLTPVTAVIARWSKDLDVIYVISSVLCTALTVDE